MDWGLWGFVIALLIARILGQLLLTIMAWQIPTMGVCSPLKLFEYMAAGWVIVGESFPTIKENVDEQTALLAQPEDFEDLCSKLSTALAQYHPSPMAEKARQLAIQEYTWHQRPQKILDSLNELH